MSTSIRRWSSFGSPRNHLHDSVDSVPQTPPPTNDGYQSAGLGYRYSLAVPKEQQTRSQGNSPRMKCRILPHDLHNLEKQMHLKFQVTQSGKIIPAAREEGRRSSITDVFEKRPHPISPLANEATTPVSTNHPLSNSGFFRDGKDADTSFPEGSCHVLRSNDVNKMPSSASSSPGAVHDVTDESDDHTVTQF